MPVPVTEVVLALFIVSPVGEHGAKGQKAGDGEDSLEWQSAFEKPWKGCHDGNEQGTHKRCRAQDGVIIACKGGGQGVGEVAVGGLFKAGKE